MVSHTSQVNIIPKKFQHVLKKVKTKQSLNKAYCMHKKDHENLLKKHLEEMAMIN